MNVSVFLTLVFYIIMIFVVARIAYVNLDHDYPDDDRNRSTAGWIGVIWPLAVLVSIVLWIADHTIGRETSRQKKERLKLEQYLVEANKLDASLLDPGNKD